MSNYSIDVEESLYKVFHKFIELFDPSEKVYMANRNSNTPKGPFTSVRISSIDSVSHAATGIERYEVNGIPETTTWSIYKASIAISCFGNLAMRRALNIKAALRDKSLRALLSANGVGYSSSGDIADISRSVDSTKIEPAALFVVEVYFALGGADRGPAIDYVESVESMPGTLNP